MKFKEGDIVEIVDIGVKDIFYGADNVIGTRIKLTNYIDNFSNATNLQIGNFGKSYYNKELDHISLYDDYRIYFDVKVKKVRTLTPKRKRNG